MDIVLLMYAWIYEYNIQGQVAAIELRSCTVVCYCSELQFSRSE